MEDVVCRVTVAELRSAAAAVDHAFEELLTGLDHPTLRVEVAPEAREAAARVRARCGEEEGDRLGGVEFRLRVVFVNSFDNEKETGSDLELDEESWERGSSLSIDFVLVNEANRYVGMLFVKASSRPSDILPLLRNLAGFPAHEEIELYEIESGDIICYQKSPKPKDKYPYLRVFFQHIYDQKVCILREGKHPNIVTIAGVCLESCALVSPNGNPEDNIFCTNGSPPPLWHKRAQIIAEVCSALLYLHSNKPNALVHGDLRPCNILLDANNRSKLCKFGTSNPFLDPGVCAANLTARLPYMDPEFLTTGELTPLSEVYSLGVIICAC
ncbi:U-box domain-containing protein 57 [Dichanthelium oligosanthes]|uniref:RING-type E3 ubiquitin transferase n=1 Tax=Dichanthelium oligosanthes TaxID=888268 RepID=A0A1E5V1E7_9POAL|nr:U-box domain-containing protein 57 [Dichanthelium oligosanthes]